VRSLRRIAVLAHASVLDGSDLARRVVDLAIALRRHAIAPEVAVWTVESPRALRRRDARVALSAALGAAGVGLEIVHAWPRGLGLARVSDRVAAHAIARLLARRGADVLHAHGPRATRTALEAAAGGVPVVTDVFGDRAAEARLARGDVPDLGAAPTPEDAAAVREAAGAVYASEALAARFPVSASRPTAVVPRVVADERIPSDEVAEAERAARRKAMGLSGEERVVACAGAVAREDVGRLARIVRHLVERVPQARFLVLSPDREGAERTLRAAGLAPGIASTAWAGGGDVVRALLGADAGVVLYRPALAHALSFPAEFGEYLAAGLAVGVSDTVPALASRIAGAPALGFALPYEADDGTWAARLSGAAKPSGAAERAARRAWARAHLSWSSAAPALRALYERT